MQHALPLLAAEVPADSFLNNLPPGVILREHVTVPEEQLKPIARKLEATIDFLSNSKIDIHGRPIQVNVIASQQESSVKSIHSVLARLKPFPFTARHNNSVVELVGTDLDLAIGIKAMFELGLVEKPKTASYEVVADIAAVDVADYMACNPLFNAFVALQNNSRQDALVQIGQLSKRFQFGSSLCLRSPELDETPAKHSTQPGPDGSETGNSIVRYSFDNLPIRHGVPYVTAKLTISTTETAFVPNEKEPLKELVAPTKYWPADDAEILALAQSITEGKTSNGAKAMAILEWLTPGKNFRYTGETGSRYGVSKVLQQKFGHCWDFSDCFVTLARASGVPCRQVAGWLYGASGHVWAEFYRNGKGWQQVDPTGGGVFRCGIYHIPYFSSDDGEMPILYVYMPKIELMNPPKQ